MEAFTTILMTKDDLLSYYIEDQPQIEPNLFGTYRTAYKQ